MKNYLFLILEPSGIFVKSITKSSAVEHDGRIQIGDQIIAVSYMFNTGVLQFSWLRIMLSGIGEMVWWVRTCIVFPENPSLVPSTCVGQPRTTSTHIHVNKNEIFKWINNSLCIYVCSCECSMHAVVYLCAYVLTWPWVPEARGQCWMSSSIAFCVCLFVLWEHFSLSLELISWLD